MDASTHLMLSIAEQPLKLYYSERTNEFEGEVNLI
jgi:hypothetical protein